MHTCTRTRETVSAGFRAGLKVVRRWPLEAGGHPQLDVEPARRRSGPRPRLGLQGSLRCCIFEFIFYALVVIEGSSLAYVIGNHRSY